MNICVYCGSNSGKNPKFKQMARQVGRAIAKKGDVLVYGGSMGGMMGAAADACLEAGGKVVGVMPSLLTDKEIAHNGLTKFYETKDMEERKNKMMRISDAFVILPGGFGTLEELYDTLSASQLGIHKSPIAIFNIDGFFDPILDMMDRVVSETFAPDLDRGLILWVDSTEEMYQEIESFVYQVGKKYVG